MPIPKSFSSLHLASSIAVLTALAAAPQIASADGLYVSESFGGSKAKDELADYMDGGLNMRLSLGYRKDRWAGEVWFGAAVPLEGNFACAECGSRNGVDEGLVQYGFDVKYISPLAGKLEGYVRGGLTNAIAAGYEREGSEQYSGRGLAGGVGIQIKGKVPALGLLWAPLFLTDIGPKITAAAFVDTGIEFYRLQSAGRPTIDAQLNTIRVGFAFGSDF
jgi:hypothetical protein